VDGADEQLFRLRRPRSFLLGSSFGYFCGLLNGASGMELAETTDRRIISTIHPGGRCSICQQSTTSCHGDLSGPYQPGLRPGKIVHALLYAGEQCHDKARTGPDKLREDNNYACLYLALLSVSALGHGIAHALELVCYYLVTSSTI
jgi:hypothetical protein